jgi:hypothetical protein|tara:strand:- start:10809 stop:11144 length:336 start_codon:yes stop_codon:yes gene_type:complete
MSSAVSLNQYVLVMHTGVVRQSETRGRPSLSPLCTACVLSLHFLPSVEPFLFAQRMVRERGVAHRTPTRWDTRARVRTAFAPRAAPTAAGTTGVMELARDIMFASHLKHVS